MATDARAEARLIPKPGARDFISARGNLVRRGGAVRSRNEPNATSVRPRNQLALRGSELFTELTRQIRGGEELGLKVFPAFFERMQAMPCVPAEIIFAVNMIDPVKTAA